MGNPALALYAGDDSGFLADDLFCGELQGICQTITR
jgi:hypothetical protein